MAIYHFSAKVVQRSAGHSSVAAAAYSSGTRLVDQRTSIIHDFSSKPGVVKSEILLPEQAPVWLKRRNFLWNKVEQSEKRQDAQVARSLDIALPRELTIEQNWALIKDFVRANFTSLGMIADVNFHNDNPNNPHVHILLTMRPLAQNSTRQNVFSKKKNRRWNDRRLLIEWRKSWQNFCNQRLSQFKHRSRIDHRSHQARGISFQPTIHVGKAAHYAYKYRGVVLERMKKNQTIESGNSLKKSTAPMQKIGFFASKSKQERSHSNSNQNDQKSTFTIEFD